MRAFFRIFKNKWLITLIGFIALAILVWFVGPHIAIAGKVPLATPLARALLIIVFALIWALNLLRVQISLNRANSQLTTEMSAGAVDELATDDARRSEEEIDKLKGRFDEALQVLRKTGKEKGKGNIYELPWYIIIGPPGSGKTTALVNSGLHFPLAEQFGKEALRGVGGTRNCDWWFTDEAVLLDTAGRYTTQDSHAQADKAAWEGFLQLLVRHRKRRPINGALIAISVFDLLTQSPAERDAQISAIRHRLEELNTQLKVSFPVYILFTKSDLIPGFSEFFEDLGREERGQVWGMTFPYAGFNDSAVMSEFNEHFDALVDRLNQRVVTRMEQERDVERRARIFGFVQQFDALKFLMGEFLEEIFKSSRYQSDTLLRGVYFTSGTQEGTPIDRVLASLSRTLGVNAQSMATPSVQGKSYFITRLFRDLIFTEAELAGANRRVEIQRYWVQRAAYATAVIVTGLAVLAWTTSYTRNQVYVNRAGSALEEHQAVAATEGSEQSDFSALVKPLNSSRAVLNVYEPFTEDVPFLMGMGLYQGKRISTAAEDAYQMELQRLLLPAIADRLERHLEIGENDPDFQYQALKTYLMLGNPEHLDGEVVKGWMELDWGVSFPGKPELQGQLQEHLAAMIALGFEPIGLDEGMVNSARANLKLVPASELLYGMIKRDYIATDEHPLSLTDLYGNSGSKVFEHTSDDPAQQRISSLFTYEGYHEYYKKQLPNFVEQAEREAWVLEDEPRVLSLPEKNHLRDELRELYFSDFMGTWEHMLTGIQVTSFDSLPLAAGALGIASSASSPIKRVLEVTARNTSLANTEALGKIGELGGKVASKSRFGRLFESAAESVSDTPVSEQIKLPEQVVNDRFEPLNELTRPNEAGAIPLDPILSLLSQLYGKIDAVSGGYGQDPIALVKGGGDGDIFMRLQVEAARQPEPVRGWLLEFIRNSREASFGSARAHINREWQATVYPECRAAMNGRYPFFRDAKREMTLADFGRLFRPGGSFDSFFNSHLKPFTEVKGGRRRWKNIDGMGIGIPDAVLRQFQRASSIGNMFFQGGGNTPAVAFKMKPVYLDANVDAVNLNLEGQNFVYRHGPQYLQNARWPNPDGNGRVGLEFSDDSGNPLVYSYEGVWAWFRLLGTSKLESKTGDIAVATFEHRGRRTSWELHAQSVENPFLMGQFNRFRCPESL